MCTVLAGGGQDARDVALIGVPRLQLVQRPRLLEHARVTGLHPPCSFLQPRLGQMWISAPAAIYEQSSYRFCDVSFVPQQGVLSYPNGT